MNNLGSMYSHSRKEKTKNFVRKLESSALIKKENNSFVCPKAPAKKIYENEFRIPKISFSKMVGRMVYDSILMHTGNQEIIKFNPWRLQQLLGKLITDEPTDEKKRPRKIIVSQSIAFKKKKKPIEFVSEVKCDICNEKFDSREAHEKHIKSDNHILRQQFATTRWIFNKTKVKDIIVEAIPGSNNTTENLFVSETSSIVLRIENVSDTDYEILDIVKMNPDEKRIEVLQFKLPSKFPKHSSQYLNILTKNFNWNTSLFYPLIFVFKNLDTKAEVKILKDLCIHLCKTTSDIIRELIPKGRYKKPTPIAVDYKDDLLVAGERPAWETSFSGEIFLEKYELSSCLVKIFNAGLEESETLNIGQTMRLFQIRELLDVPDHSNPLSIKKYTRLLEMFLFMEEHQVQKNIRDYDRDNQKLLPAPGFPKNFFKLEVPGLAEKRPSVMRGDCVFVKEGNASRIKYQGFVHKVEKSSVVLGFGSSFPDREHVKKTLFSVFFTINRYPLRVAHQAVNLVREYQIGSTFFPKSPGGVHCHTYHYHWFETKIESNPEQQQAVRHICETTAYPAPYLVFGPPGTGKTMTIVEAILQIHKLKPKFKILVCAPSNSAADEIAKKLIHLPKTDVLRYMSASYPYDAIPREVQPFTNYYGERFYYPTSERVTQFRIVVATLVNSARMYNAGIPPNHFNYVFIDESGHANEAETLIPITASVLSLGKVSGQVVLAGDPKQLGPIVHSVLGREYGFSTSMLERMMNTLPMYQKQENGQYDSMSLTKLLKNYRSHPAILKIPNELFYDNELIPEAGETAHLAVGWKHLPNPDFPIIFHSVKGLEHQEEHSPSYFNILEISQTLFYLEELLGSRLSNTLIEEEHIGVVTPYSRQVQKLRLACRKKGWENLTVDSVEKLQGQERLIIIVSTVRSQPDFMQYDHKFHLGFLKNPKRMNVTLTRAKALLIVIGNPDILQHDQYWNKFIHYCIQNNGFVGDKFIATVDEAVDEQPVRPADEQLVDPVDELADLANLSINDDTDSTIVGEDEECAGDKI